MDTQYGESAPPPADPYSEAYNEPPTSSHAIDRERDVPPPRGRSRSRSPPRDSFRRPSPVPKKPSHAPIVSVVPPSLTPRVLTRRSRRLTRPTCWVYSV